jgi:hypothetical protein
MKIEDIKQYLKDNLTIDVEGGDFTCPNYRTIVLRLEGEIISTTTFDVVQKGEYEG